MTSAPTDVVAGLDRMLTEPLMGRFEFVDVATTSSG
jgi:hypothetical protein